MANTDKNFDQFFRDKLSKHEEKPSSLAWERLESQLPKKDKKAWLPIMGIAASLIMIMTASYVVWQSSQQADTFTPQTAEVLQEEYISPVEKGETLDEIPPNIEEAQTSIQTPNKEVAKSEDLPKNKIKKEVPAKTEIIAELVAENKISSESKEVAIIKAKPIAIPELNITETIAANTTEEKPVENAEEVITYKITIKSNGIKEQPEKQGLIAGIENKVEKIGGLLGKVEQGFADLQDAKENLFLTSNTSKKERK